MKPQTAFNSLTLSLGEFVGRMSSMMHWIMHFLSQFFRLFQGVCLGSYPDGFWVSPHLSTMSSYSVILTLKDFLMFRCNLLCFSLCLLLLVQWFGTTESSLCPNYPFLLCVCVHWDGFSPFSGQNRPRSLSLPFYERCFSPLIIFMALVWTLSTSTMPLLNWGVQTWT